MAATSFGTGELIRAALDHGLHAGSSWASAAARRTDGGAGMLQALGARFLDAAGCRAAARAGAPLIRPGRGRPGPRWTRGWRASSSSWPATSTTRCSARGARPRSTARRRARPRPTSSCSTTRLARLAAAIDPGAATITGSGRGWRRRLRRSGVLRRHPAAGHRRGAGPGRLPGPRSRARGWSSPARAGWTSRPCTARRRPGWPLPRPGAGVPVVAVSGGRDLDDARLHAAGFAAAYALTDIEPDVAALHRRAGAAARAPRPADRRGAAVRMSSGSESLWRLPAVRHLLVGLPARLLELLPDAGVAADLGRVRRREPGRRPGW